MTILDSPPVATDTAVELVERHAAHNYSPLPVVAASAEGAWITDVDGRRYLDCLAAYSAVNFGHRNPEITATAHAQLDTVTGGCGGHHHRQQQQQQYNNYYYPYGSPNNNGYGYQGQGNPYDVQTTVDVGQGQQIVSGGGYGIPTGGNSYNR